MAIKEKEIWVIKAGFPNKPEKYHWSDYPFAHSLKRHLEKRGITVIIESTDEWDTHKNADVVVAIRGPKRYYPNREKQECIYIFWSLCYPSLTTEQEYNDYDYVCTGSVKEAFVKDLRKRLLVPVKSLPICVDTELFCPLEEEKKEKEYDWIFVGNARKPERTCIRWALEEQMQIKIWGAFWKRYLPESESCVVNEFIHNDQLPELYRNAKATIDDHHKDMIENGFLNTRILEAFSCGLPVVSDYSKTTEEIFGDTVLLYKNKEEFIEQTKALKENYEEIKKKIKQFWPVILKNYSFEHHADELITIANAVRYERKKNIEFLEQWKNEEHKNDKEPLDRFYEKWKYICQNYKNISDERNFAIEIWELQRRYKRLDWSSRYALSNMKGTEGVLFQTFISNPVKWERELSIYQIEYRNVYEKIEKLEKQNEKVKNNYQEACKEKQRLNEMNCAVRKEKHEMYEKLQKTYDEKYERGLEIKKLKKEIEGIKKSKTYRLARILGGPIRWVKAKLKYR